ncbi:MAG: NYN domain-containing protein, partial [Acidimicrobiales bacterium]
MPVRHVVVDGSNIATEGRSLPSLGQLDQAVREFLADNPDDVVTVVVDASFGHRIDATEVVTFEEAEAAGEVVSPPAGAIGRGDAFLLRIAEKTGATVLSNDSFQEFHGEHDWLFSEGRLVGGKPVPGVGWIFTPRTPVRGPKSREAVKEAKRRRRPETVTGPEASGLEVAAVRAKGKAKKVERAIARATEEAVEPDRTKRRRRRRGGEQPADPLNEPLTFITFIAGHPLGTEVSGLIESFSSHGAFVTSAGTRCYVPLSAMGNPPPRAAREVLTRGEERQFVVQALDPLRRGVELALPGFARLAGAPTDETVEAEISPEQDVEPETSPAPKRRSRARVPAAPPQDPPVVLPAPEPAAAEAAPATEVATVPGAATRTAKAARDTTKAPPAAGATRPTKAAKARAVGTAKAPMPAGAPEPAGAPMPAGVPEPTGAPEPAGAPMPAGAPEPTKSPEPAGATKASKAPRAPKARAPEATEAPEATKAVKPTKAPKVPKATKDTKASKAPRAPKARAPEATEAPEATKAVKQTEAPKARAPEATEAPEATKAVKQ